MMSIQDDLSSLDPHAGIAALLDMLEANEDTRVFFAKPKPRRTIPYYGGPIQPPINPALLVISHTILGNGRMVFNSRN